MCSEREITVEAWLARANQDHLVLAGKTHKLKEGREAKNQGRATKELRLFAHTA